MHGGQGKSGHPGLILRSPLWYDIIVWLFTLGRPRTFRERMLQEARLRPGESVLDVGCGTGSLALLAKAQVGIGGSVCGIDASPEMIERARRKAAGARADVDFVVAHAQAIPFADSSFDVVLSTLTFHHLPRPSRERLAAEMKRVMKRDGRAFVVDFAKKTKRAKGIAHRGHGATSLADMAVPLGAAGLKIVATGEVGVKELHFVLAQSEPLGGSAPDAGSQPALEPEGASGRRPRVGLLLAVALLAVVALHAAGLVAAGAAFELAWPKLAIVGLAAVGVAIVKLVIARFVHRAKAEERRS